jgi:hypothetical protein
MNRFRLAALAALAALPSFAAQAQVEKFDLSRPGLDSQARCAALFAIVANEQRRKAPGSDRFPPMAEEGREFFVQTGMRLKAERNLEETAVKGYFMELIGSIQKEYAEAPDAGTKLDKEMTVCLAMRSDVLPPKPVN